MWYAGGRRWFRCWRGRASDTRQHRRGRLADKGEREATHDSARCAEGLWGKVGGELGLDSARLSVWSGDSSSSPSACIRTAHCRMREGVDSPPDDSDSAAVDLTLGTVDVGDSLRRSDHILDSGSRCAGTEKPRSGSGSPAQPSTEHPSCLCPAFLLASILPDLYPYPSPSPSPIVVIHAPFPR